MSVAGRSKMQDMHKGRGCAHGPQLARLGRGRHGGGARKPMLFFVCGVGNGAFWEGKGFISRPVLGKGT